MLDPKAEIQVPEINEREVFVGPRPFERSEQNLFFGRDREVSELLSLVTSNRVVLCYAPSGAGKTSLINAGLQPRLEKEGFEVLPSTRVRGLIPEGVDQSSIANIYIFNAILSLSKETGDLSDLAHSTLAGYLSTVPHQTDEEDFPSPRILIFDQFEELLTSYLEQWKERDGFFQQVKDALENDSLLRVLFVMREDYVARIEPFLPILKPLQQTRFRLDLLGPDGAKAAVTGPLRGTRRYFKEGVVDALIEELQKVRVESTQGEATEVIGEYVEPVQLQVVCRNLWNGLPADVEEITHDHLKTYGDVNQALRDFYEACLVGAKTNLRANERDLRQWFERQLITPAGTRSIVFRDAQQTAGLQNTVVDFLENRHVIRGEWRAGSRWYELTHDRLIEPIQGSNQEWQVRYRTRRNQLAIAFLLPLFLALLFLARSFGTQQAVAQIAATETVSVATAGAVQTISAVIAAQEDAMISSSRRLAAEALLANDQRLSFLLAIEANKADDTAEARRSLHKVISAQGMIDGKFLREFNAELLSPTLVKRLNDHQGPVVSVAFSPDGQHFVSGSSNGTVLLWNVVTLTPSGPSLNSRRSGIDSVAFSPDGRLVAFAGLDEQISLWDTATGNAFGVPLRGHVGLVTCIAFSPDGKLLASGGMDQFVRIWDVQTQTLVTELKDLDTIGSVAWSPDGSVLVWGTYSSNATFWKTGTSEPYDTLRLEKNPILSIAWSPDGQTLAFGMASEEGRQEDGEVLLWDFANRMLITQPVPDNLVRIRSIAFHPSGKILAIGRDDGSVVLWDVSRQQMARQPLIAHSHRVMSIAFSPDGRYLISVGYEGTIAIWNLQAATNSIAVSPDGSLLATSQGSVISLWNIHNSETAPMILAGHTEDILALTFSPDGHMLVSSGLENQLLFWNVDTGQQIRGSPVNSNVRALQFSPDGALLAVAGDSGRAQLSLPVTGEVVYRLIEQQGPPILKIQFRPDGSMLDIVANDGRLTQFAFQAGEPSIVGDSVLPSAQDGILSIALSQDGKKAAYFRSGGTGETAILSNEDRAHGIDLSFWNQSFDATVNPDDIDFVLVKATEGTQYVDPNFEKYVKQIQPVPLHGAYHYFRVDQPWQAQADLFLSTVKDKGFHFYVLYLDSAPKGDNKQLLADVQQWLEYVNEQVDGRVLLGTTNTFLSEFGSAVKWLREWPLLISQYPREIDRDGNPALPQGFTDWKIWNYTDQGNSSEFGTTAEGVSLNVYNGTPEDMGEWLGLNAFSILDRSSGAVIHPNIPVEINGANSFIFSPDSLYLAATGNGKVFLLNTATGEEISTLNLGGRTVHSLNFVTNSDALVIGTDDGAVLLWDLSLLRSAAEIRPMIDIACSQIQQNFTRAEWSQYYGPGAAYQATCTGALVP